MHTFLFTFGCFEQNYIPKNCHFIVFYCGYLGARENVRYGMHVHDFVTDNTRRKLLCVFGCRSTQLSDMRYTDG